MGCDHTGAIGAGVTFPYSGASVSGMHLISTGKVGKQETIGKEEKTALPERMEQPSIPTQFAYFL